MGFTVFFEIIITRGSIMKKIAIFLLTIFSVAQSADAAQYCLNQGCRKASVNSAWESYSYWGGCPGGSVPCPVGQIHSANVRLASPTKAETYPKFLYSGAFMAQAPHDCDPAEGCKPIGNGKCKCDDAISIKAVSDAH